MRFRSSGRRSSSPKPLGAIHPNTLVTRQNLGAALRDAGKFDEAIALLTSTSRLVEAKLGPEHPVAFAHHNHLALRTRMQEERRKRSGFWSLRCSFRRRSSGSIIPKRSALRVNLAACYTDAGKAPQAVAILEPALKIHQAKLGPSHPDTLSTCINLSTAYDETGRIALAPAAQ